MSHFKSNKSHTLSQYDPLIGPKEIKIDDETDDDDDYNEYTKWIPPKLEKRILPTTIKRLNQLLTTGKNINIEFIKIIGTVRNIKQNTAHSLVEYNKTVQIDDLTSKAVNIIFEGNDNDELPNINIATIDQLKLSV